jgi:hypothetical protein
MRLSFFVKSFRTARASVIVVWWGAEHVVVAIFVWYSLGSDQGFGYEKYLVVSGSN